jgi:hypothetical protein
VRRPLLAITIALLLSACQTPAPAPPPPAADSAILAPAPVGLAAATTHVAPKDLDGLRFDFLELSILRQELPFVRRLVLLRRQERGIWRQRVEDRKAGVRDLMPISQAYQTAIADRDRLIAREQNLHRKLAGVLKRTAATLRFDFSGLIRDPSSLSIDLESLVHLAQRNQPTEDEITVAQTVRDSFQSLAATTEALAEFAGDTHALMRGVNRDLRNLSVSPEAIPNDVVDARIQLLSTRLHGLQLLRSQQHAVLTLETAIGAPLSLDTFPDLAH